MVDLAYVALDALSSRQLETVADLHHAAMPTSLLTRLGPAIVRRFYRAVPRSSHLFGVAAVEGDRVRGAVVGTPEPNDAFDDVARPLWRFAAHVVRHRPRMLAQLVIAKLRPAHDVARPPKSAELMYVFSDPTARGRGIGKHLVDAFEDAARARGLEYVTLSVEIDNAAAIGLYERRGFTISAANHHEGETVCHRMTKTLA